MAVSKRTPLDFKTIESLPAPQASPSTRAADNEDRQQVGARVKTGIYRQLKARAAMEGNTVQDLVEQAIVAFLKA
jgi:hypothetical protein